MASKYFNLEVGIGVFHRYEPVNECIYCGATENLSDEHVIPFALSGRSSFLRQAAISAPR
jgi:hypothetical protein